MTPEVIVEKETQETRTSQGKPSNTIMASDLSHISKFDFFLNGIPGAKLTVGGCRGVLG